MAKTDKSSKDKKEACEKLRALNEEAYEDLLFAMPGDTDKGKVVFNIVSLGKTKAFKDGDAREVWKKLLKKFEPNTAPNCLISRKSSEA